jgi:hypothetical protein
MLRYSLRLLFVILFVLVQGCGGGGSNAGDPKFDLPSNGPAVVTSPSLQLSSSRAVITSGSPADLKATLTDGSGRPVAGQVITFKVVRSLGVTNLATALTDANGNAFVQLSPASTTGAGADEVTASVTYAGKELQQTLGFQVNATAVTLAFEAPAADFQLPEFAQTSFKLQVTGAATGSPVNLNVSSACVALGKATISPSSGAVTSNSITLQYMDLGCGAHQTSDVIEVSVAGGSARVSISVPLTRPGVSSLAFIRSVPEMIYLKGSGLAESAVLTFEVRDAAGNPLANEAVTLALASDAGGALVEGKAWGQDAVLRSGADGRIQARVNSGSVPSPIRVIAKLTTAVRTISTVSSNLGVAVGLPSQLNFSLSQGTINIEGFDIDGVTNTYAVIASDRNGNPIHPGTAINFVAEAGQVEALKSVQVGADGISRTTANFVAAAPRPADGRVTITAYALGEESFIDTNGNNAYDAGEPFQDLGAIFKDRNFNAAHESGQGEDLLVVAPGSTSTCVTPSLALLNSDGSITSTKGATCDGKWSGSGTVYVRRSVETVLSTSASRLLWSTPSPSTGATGLGATCALTIPLQTDGMGFSVAFRPLVTGDVWYAGAGATSVSLRFWVGDRNAVRWNPLAAGSAVAWEEPEYDATSSGVTSARFVPRSVTVPSSDAPTPIDVQLKLNGAAVGFSQFIQISTRSPRGIESSHALKVVKQDRPATDICP